MPTLNEQRNPNHTIYDEMIGWTFCSKNFRESTNKLFVTQLRYFWTEARNTTRLAKRFETSRKQYFELLTAKDLHRV
jgi:hypothetical protein